MEREGYIVFRPTKERKIYTVGYVLYANMKGGQNPDKAKQYQDELNKLNRSIE